MFRKGKVKDNSEVADGRVFGCQVHVQILLLVKEIDRSQPELQQSRSNFLRAE